MEQPYTDVLVVGAGAAGLSAAIAAASMGAHTTLIDGGQSASALSVADISVVDEALKTIGLRSVASDTSDGMRRRILNASFGVADPARVDVYVSESAVRFQSLLSFGLARFQYIGKSTLLVPGKHLDGVLRAKVAALNIHVLQGHVIAFVADGNAVIGGVVRLADGELIKIRVGAVVLATGGYKTVVGFSTFSCGLSLSGTALALQVGCKLIDAEAIGFCPFVATDGLLRGSIAPYLVNKALVDAHGKSAIRDEPAPASAPSHSRSAAAIGEWDKLLITLDVLRNTYPQAFDAARSSLRGQLRPAILMSLLRTAVRHRGASGYPGVRTVLRQSLVGRGAVTGIAAHYSCGGIECGIDGDAGPRRFFVCGEVAGGTFGVHRVESSITDCLVFGHRAGVAAARSVPSDRPAALQFRLRVPQWDGSIALAAVRHVMTGAFGPVRDVESVRAAIPKLDRLAEQYSGGEASSDGNHCAAAHTLTVARAVAAAAVKRTDSRGWHFLIDSPCLNPGMNSSTVTRIENGREVLTVLKPRSAGVGTVTDYESYVAMCVDGDGA